MPLTLGARRFDRIELDGIGILEVTDLWSGGCRMTLHNPASPGSGPVQSIASRMLEHGDRWALSRDAAVTAYDPVRSRVRLVFDAPRRIGITRIAAQRTAQ